MKKISKIVACLLILSVVVILLVSCTEDNPYKKYDYMLDPDYFETDYFKCLLKDGRVHIVGLMDQGLLLNEIVIPTTIGSEQEVVIGYDALERTEYNFNSGKVEKYFINQQTDIIYSDLIARNIILFAPLPNESTSLIGNIYIPEFVYDQFESLYPWMKHVANVSFLYNYQNSPNSGYYWVDNLEIGQVINTFPVDPLREGYVFGGWYNDTSLTQKWNSSITKSYEPIKLYAKWIQIDFSENEGI
ncbi:MAG: InlB B-repeat-containing protein [Christensenellaceae bacterium]|jgi:uncharacterized repeat protein (TIGR02543 family)|nr:InlB B-repeat-containing protein [Christensenellaceae bacterium]